MKKIISFNLAYVPGTVAFCEEHIERNEYGQVQHNGCTVGTVREGLHIPHGLERCSTCGYDAYDADAGG